MEEISMNKVILVGRICRDIEVRYSQGDKPTAVARFSVAVDRKFKTDGQPEADFPSCIAFGKTAEFLEKYFSKGMKIVVEGRLTTGSYEKDGVKHYTTDVTVENVEFAEGKREDGSQGRSSRPEPSAAMGDGFMNIPDGIEEGLPFN
jgi:single-strand DNA-binding protein